MRLTDEIELDVSIDKNRLDEQWEEQPRLRFRYGAELAESRRTLAQAKAAVDVMAADLDNEIRESPEDFGLSKITEAAIKAAIPANPRYKAAQRKLIDAEYEVNILTAAVAALDHRKSGLENEVRLWMGDYFSGPKAPEGAAEKVREFERSTVRGKGRRLEREDNGE